MTALAANAVGKVEMWACVRRFAIVHAVTLQALLGLTGGLGLVPVEMADHLLGALVVEHLKCSGVQVVAGPGAVLTAAASLWPIGVVARRRGAGGHAHPAFAHLVRGLAARG